MRHNNESDKKENRYVEMVKEFGKPYKDFPKRNAFALQHLQAGDISNREYEELAIEGQFGPKIKEAADELLNRAIDNLIKGK